MDSGGVPGRTSSLPEVSCKIRNNVGARTSTRKREDNLSRPRPMEFLLSASRNSYLRFRDSSLSLPISYSRDKSRSGIVTTLPKVAYIWTRLGPRISERTFEKRLQDISLARETSLFVMLYAAVSVTLRESFSAITSDTRRKYFEKNKLKGWFLEI